MEKIKNLALKSYPVFFNRLNMGIHSDGTLESLRYVDKTPGTTVYDDGTVEFAFFAPDAKSVEVCGVSGTLPKEHIELKKEEDGWFRKRVPVPAGFHYLNWFVDGVACANPEGMITYGCFENIGFLDVPEKGETFWLRKDVPHGTVHYEFYINGVHYVGAGLGFVTPLNNQTITVLYDPADPSNNITKFSKQKSSGICD